MTDQEQIEKYLADELTPQERDVFEQRLNREPELSASLTHYKATIDFFATRNPALEATLEEMGNKYIKDQPWYQSWWFRSVLGVVAIGGIFYLWQTLFPSDTRATVSPASQNESMPVDTSSSAPATFPDQEEAPIEAPPGNDNDPTDNTQRPSRQEEETQPPPPPIAQTEAADYSPNPDLEELLNTYVRSTDFFIIESPPATLPLNSSQNNWQLKGRTTLGAPLELKLYSNVPEDFFEDQPEWAQTVIPTGTADTLQISQAFPRPAKAGLYYWLLLDTETEELKAAGKIIVEE